MSLAEDFGRNLAQARRRDGYSQTELAERSGLHSNAIWGLEKGVRKPGLDTLLRLLGALEVSADDLLNGLRPEAKKQRRQPLPSLYE